MGWSFLSNTMRWRPVGLFSALILANLAAWYWAWHAFAGQPALMGTALLAWVFGLRHAVDADHIAAIDNVVRKLMRDGQRPVMAGFWFALGHASVVALASAGVAVAASAMTDQLIAFKSIAGPIGASVSAGFLLLIAAINLSILLEVWRGFRHVARGGSLDETGLDRLLTGGGWLARLCRPLFQSIRRSWHMFPLGFLFGLGFDTATEVGLLGIAASRSSLGLDAINIMIFPALFAAGMVLVDTADSALMVGAYGWAFSRPLRKLWYNLTITAISIAVALLIGGLEALGVLIDRFALEGGIWSAVTAVNANLVDFGFLTIAVFVVAWGISASVYHWKGYDRLATVSGRTGEPGRSSERPIVPLKGPAQYRASDMAIVGIPVPGNRSSATVRPSGGRDIPPNTCRGPPLPLTERL